MWPDLMLRVTPMLPPRSGLSRVTCRMGIACASQPCPLVHMAVNSCTSDKTHGVPYTMVHMTRMDTVWLSKTSLRFSSQCYLTHEMQVQFCDAYGPSQQSLTCQNLHSDRESMARKTSLHHTSHHTISLSIFMLGNTQLCNSADLVKQPMDHTHSTGHYYCCYCCHHYCYYYYYYCCSCHCCCCCVDLMMMCYQAI